ncbi:protein sgm1 [Apiospora arundinis]
MRVASGRGTPMATAPSMAASIINEKKAGPAPQRAVLASMVLGGQVNYVADAAEDPGDEAGDLSGQRRVRKGDDGHALADLRRRVGDGPHDAAAAIDLRVVLGDGTVQDRLNVLGRHADADTDEQLAVQRLAQTGLAQQLGDHGRLAGEQDHLGLRDGGDVLALDHLDDGAVRPQRLLHALGRLGAPHAGDEAAWQTCGERVVEGVGGAVLHGRLKRLRGLEVGERAQDAREDGNAHGACASPLLAFGFLESVPRDVLRSMEI